MHIYMKACERCSGEVPLSTTVGDLCLHCGVRFGGERTRINEAAQSISSATTLSSDRDDLRACLGVVAIALLIVGSVVGFHWITSTRQDESTPVQQEQTIQQLGARA